MLDHSAEHPHPGTAAPAPGHTPIERAAYAFYVVAALGSSIGQIWVGVEVPPWPGSLPLWARALLVLPFAVVIDLGGAVASGFADARRRLGETAYGWRILSAASVSLAVGINVVGHARSPYLAVVFGGLGVFAYSVWLLHSAARRRDALRSAGMMRTTTPAYGPAQWISQPRVTRRARLLAIEHGYGLVQSLSAARAQIATEERRAALAAGIKAEIRAQHEDPILAAIAVTTAPVDDVAQALMEMIDAQGWAHSLYDKIDPPTPALPAASPQPDTGADGESDPDAARKLDSSSGSKPDRGSHANAAVNAAAEDLWIDAASRGVDLSSSKLLTLFHQHHPHIHRGARWAVHRRNAARQRLHQQQLDTSVGA